MECQSGFKRFQLIDVPQKVGLTIMNPMVEMTNNHLKQTEEDVLCLLFSELFCLITGVVDGRNPAPVDMVNILLSAGFHSCWVVVWDFCSINICSLPKTVGICQVDIFPFNHQFSIAILFCPISNPMQNDQYFY